MPNITVLPNTELCPEGAVVAARKGQTICEALQAAGIEIEHACEHACACSTCHVIVREGFATLDSADEGEEDMLDRAWGLEPHSRLACQAFVKGADLTIEIPRYSRNLAKEKKA
ncbi:ISC system 2Fe-2S type ferredoxin [Methylocaldum sp.]|uniref:ISC system 2Fe-2S type ferredoxin n=1 Tax=Methylocaldum sp. TaxID=1969727 RepID=UPI002D23E54C|nr:ISC system 2Fe-2S type ferredoxin [Methylocaldum sp.]HYE37493.1 ISC system 2Fe-2S type ferredoxin [Methylocaldum sp.]